MTTSTSNEPAMGGPADALRAATAQEVWTLLAGSVRPLESVQSTLEAALGAVLSRDATSTIAYPPYRRATMDGFAVRSSDLARPPVLLRRGALVRAGARVEWHGDGTCVQINTGAEVPSQADAVVPVEDCAERGDGTVEFRSAARAGLNIEEAARLLRPGDSIAPAGTTVAAGTIAALTAAGVTSVHRHRSPAIAILTTGDELTPVGSPLASGRIFESNSLLLEAMAVSHGATLTMRGHCADESESLTRSLSEVLAADVICIAGGMSKGSHDLVPAVLESLEVRWLVSSLNLKPGKPTRIGRAPTGAWVFGLPGNPVSCAVCFHLFVEPVIRALRGRPFRPPWSIKARLTSDMPPAGLRPMFQPANWFIDDAGDARVRCVPWRGSGDPFGLAAADALVYRPASAAAASAGDEAATFPLQLPA